MAVAFDSKTGNDGVLSSGTTLSHTCSGTNRLLVLVLFLGGANPSTLYTTVAATFNSVSMTSDVDVTLSQRRMIIFHLVNPTASTANVSVTWGGGGTEVALTALSYTGVNQTNPINVSNSNTSTGGVSTIGVSLTTTVANTVMVGGVNLRSSNATQTITNGTVRYTDTSGTRFAGDAAAASSGSNTITYNFDSQPAANQLVAAAVALTPTASGSLTMLGVGA